MYLRLKTKPIVRELTNRTILQHFLKQFHLRQSHYLAKIPKILLDRDWAHRVVLFADLTVNMDRTVPIPRFEHQVIIPIVDEVSYRMERKIADCDAIVFHSLPIPKGMDGCVESLDGVSARIVTVNGFGQYPAVVSRIDVGFTPMWLRKTTESRLYYVGEM